MSPPGNTFHLGDCKKESRMDKLLLRFLTKQTKWFKKQLKNFDNIGIGITL